MGNKDIDVLLVYPKTGFDFGSTIAPPHSLLAVAAPLLERGCNVRIIDQRTSSNWREELVLWVRRRPTCVGLSAMTGTQISFALEIAGIVRKESGGDIPIIWGGPHPSTVPEQTLHSDLVDIVCVGEGDYTLLELLEVFGGRRRMEDVLGIGFKQDGRCVMTPPRPLLDVENLLPVPWELIDVEKYIHRDFYIKGTQRSLDIGQTSRGCPFLCGFCSSATIRQRKWRAMSVEKSLERILGPVSRFSLDGVWIRDDEFYINRDRALQVCEGIIRSGHKIRWYTSGTRIDVFNRFTDDQVRRLKASGADTLKFGAESGSDRILEFMNKGIRRSDTLAANQKAKRCGIIPVFALMIGFPGETFEEINETIDLFIQLKRENPKAEFETICTYTALPGTPLYPTAVEMGLRPPENLEGWSNWLYDEYDVKGEKIPWFSASDRIAVGHINYMSILANASHNAIGGLRNPVFRALFKVLITPVSRYELMRLRKKWYHFAPELALARLLRRHLFYRSYKIVR